jgi:hypothetical protein
VRFTVSPDWSRNRLLQVVLLWFLVFVACLWATNVALFFAKMSLTPASIVAYYRGDEARFMPPKSWLGMLEISHFHLFAMGVLVLTLLHLLLFVPVSNRIKLGAIHLGFAGALADEAAGWLVRFVSPTFAYLKIFGFVTLQAIMLFSGAAVVWAILTAQPNDYQSSVADEEE